MVYSDILARLYRLSGRGVRLGLDRVRAAAAELGHPQNGLRCVQIAGTNGKGSVANLVAHALRAAGLEVGLFTSPHLHRFAERVQVGGVEASSDLLGSELSRVLHVAESPGGPDLTFFEVATLAALGVFVKSHVDLAVLEVGLGGRLDATSIAMPEVCAITSVGLDHTELLGDTLASIASEKVAIARAGTPLVTGRLGSEARAVVEESAAREGAPLHMLGRDFHVSEDLPATLPGAHQRDNAAVACRLVELLGEREPRLTRGVFMDALPSARWPGRFEVIDGKPRFILDCAHNGEATEALARTLSDQGERPEVMIFGALRDKNAEKNLDILRSHVGKIVLVPPPIARALDPQTFAVPGDRVARSVKEGLSLAIDLTKRDDTILVTGSLFTVAAVRAAVLDEPTDPPIGL